jgi:hypothetical protein
MLVVLGFVMELAPHKAAHGNRAKTWELVAERMRSHPKFAGDHLVSKVVGKTVRESLCSMHFWRVHSARQGSPTVPSVIQVQNAVEVKTGQWQALMKKQVKDSGTEDQLSVLDIAFQTFAHDWDEFKQFLEGGRSDAAANAVLLHQQTLQAAAWCGAAAAKGKSNHSGKGAGAAKRKRKAEEQAAAKKDCCGWPRSAEFDRSLLKQYPADAAEPPVCPCGSGLFVHARELRAGFWEQLRQHNAEAQEAPGACVPTLSLVPLPVFAEGSWI